jgi:DNA-directed RNA polymerase subunit M
MTFCPKCNSLLISKNGFLICKNNKEIIDEKNKKKQIKEGKNKKKQISEDSDAVITYCEYKIKIDNSHNLIKREKIIDNEIMIVDDEQEKITMPTIQIRCPKCDNNLAIWWLRQLRAADESEVRFFRCTECSHTWRQYD